MNETRDTLQAFKEAGFDLSRELEIEFQISTVTCEQGANVERAVRELGLTTQLEQDEDDGSWTCYCTSTMVPTYSDIVALEEALRQVASQEDGNYEGFGSFGN